MEDRKKVVLITGASSGIGKCIAEKLAAANYTVYGTSRKPERIKELLPYKMLSLDVTKQDSVEECIATIIKEEGKINILINNAGFAHLGFVEETDESLARKQIETNFWGCMRMTKAVIPFMRERNSGTILQISSLAGSIGVPMQAYYSASKHAVDGFTKSLRMELKKFNIKVVLVKPGFIKTDLADSFLESETYISDYNSLRKSIKGVIQTSLKNGNSPNKVAEDVLKILKKSNPSYYYNIGSQSTWLPKLYYIFPNLFEFGSLKKFKIK